MPERLFHNHYRKESKKNQGCRERQRYDIEIQNSKTEFQKEVDLVKLPNAEK